jgi:hypothetical protein
MEFLVPIVAAVAFIVALGQRMGEKDRQERKMQRILNRRNKSAWNRSKNK